MTPSSQREQAGLRGPVKSCEEETTYPPSTASDGREFPETKMWSKTEYDRVGRITARRWRGWTIEGGYDGTEWITRYIYSPGGLLLKVTSGKNGEPPTEQVYRYDGQGRLQSMTDSKSPDNPIAFRYDANGRKTRIAIAQPIEHPHGGAVSMSIEAFFENPQMAPYLAHGGSAITLYDANDRPTEVQLHDADGEIISRAVRVYDDRGNITEERETMEDPLKIIPAEDRSRILSGSDMSAQNLRDQLTKFLGDPSEMYSARYSYDEKGRKTQTIRNMLNHFGDRIETTYNDHGDIAKEITQHTEIGVGNEKTDRTGESTYTYEYDSNGNWTVKKTASRSLPDGQLRDSTEVRRTIEYF